MLLPSARVVTYPTGRINRSRPKLSRDIAKPANVRSSWIDSTVNSGLPSGAIRATLVSD